MSTWKKAMVASSFLLILALTSCHRQGCPNKITDLQPTEQMAPKPDLDC